MAFVRVTDPEKLQQLHEAGLLWYKHIDAPYPRHNIEKNTHTELWRARSQDSYEWHFGIVTEE